MWPALSPHLGAVSRIDGLRLRKFGAGSNLEITQAEYEAIKNAKAMYSHLISVEQNFDAVIEDYVELESTISNYAVRYLAFHLMDESDAFDAAQATISRRVVHVLATARLYRDALQQHGKAMLKADGTFQQIEAALKDAPKTDGRKLVEEIQLFDEFFDHYKFLKRKNGTRPISRDVTCSGLACRVSMSEMP